MFKINQNPTKLLASLTIGLTFLTISPPTAIAQKNTVTSPTEAIIRAPQLSQKETAKELERLTQYVIDSSFLFSQAHDSLNDQTIREQILSFQQDAEKEITSLSGLIGVYKGKVPTYGRDFKGFFMTGYSAIRGVTSDEGVLRALDTNLQRIIDAFDKSLEKTLPNDVRSAVTSVRGQLKSSADYVAQHIENV
jgi:hypothetical protein